MNRKSKRKRIASSRMDYLEKLVADNLGITCIPQAMRRGVVDGRSVHELRANVHQDLREHFVRRFDMLQASFDARCQDAWMKALQP